ncbi:MAG: hypothetical protein IPI23_07805 [Bacteroidetes bacterium]|nr:hypothetical protein [Bacteroidota bacterium]
MEKPIITRQALNIRIIKNLIWRLELLKEDVHNEEFYYSEPPEYLQNLAESIHFCVQEILMEVEPNVVMETLSSISEDECVQIY